MQILELSLRPATTSDLEFIFEVRRQTIREYVETTWGPWDDAWQWRRYVETADLPHTKVITLSGDPVGAITVRYTARAVHLDRIHLLREAQSRGLGTRLIRGVIEKAGSLALPVRLRVLRSNPAKHLYDRLEFSVIEETPTHWVMERPSVRR